MDFNKWCETEEGRSSLNIESLKAPKEQAQYLRNRLWHAFNAGARYGRVGEVRRLKEVLENLLGLKE